MDRVLLSDLQRRSAYPSVTVLLNTVPGTVLAGADLDIARGLVDRADQRLTGDVDDATRRAVVAKLVTLLEEQRGQRSGAALALMASPEIAVAARLGHRIEPRVVVDDTFATRDFVADLDRTAAYRVITVSDRRLRLLHGDRARLVEERADGWPMVRPDDQSSSLWVRSVTARLTELHARHPLPTVVVGVERTIRSTAARIDVQCVGTVTGNHDRAGWADLHHATWPIVSDWLRGNADRALAALGEARSACRFAGGIDEIWPLANEGRVETLVVESTYALPARVERDLVLRADDREAPDVIDDIVDETIEAVLRHAGRAVMVDDGALEPYGHIAAVLRY